MLVVVAHGLCAPAHPQMLQYIRNKTENYDRWIAGIAKLHRSLAGGGR